MNEHTRPATIAADLDKAFRPESVAIVGASPRPGIGRNRIVKVLLKHGYAGRVYPVTPSADEVEGCKAYDSVRDLPEVPDVVLIITPAHTVPAIIDECGEVGVRTVIVFSAGFEEIDTGKDLAIQLRAAARRHGINLLGPNCQGIWSVKARTMLTFGAAAHALDDIRHARIGVISQSGALAGAIGNYLQGNHLGCSYVVSVGNETCMDALDLLSWMIEQDDVNTVALYLEGLDDAGRLIAIAEHARARGVQIVALKAGRSAFGQEATASHTGKIASPYGIYLDVLDQAGIIVVESLVDLMAAVEVLSFLPDPRSSDDPLAGVSVLGSSGGAGALLADHSEENAVPMATFSAHTAEVLEELLPEFARKANPIDLTGQIRSIPKLFRNTAAAVAADPRTSAIVVQFASSGMSDLLENAEDFKAVVKDSGLPFIMSFGAERITDPIRREMLEAGILLAEDPYTAMRALRWLYQRAEFRTIRPASALGSTARTAPETWQDTMAFLDACGVPAAPWRILDAGQDAANVCAGLRSPLVVKALPSEAEHKTELGLVKLRVQTPEEVDSHACAFRVALGKPAMPVLVQEMITDGIEVVLSCLRDTDFGPILSIGSGGVAVELYKDVTFLALPVTEDQVRRSLSKLKVHTLLDGFRGAPRADIDALVRAAVTFGNVMLETPDLAEAEINPVLVRPEGKGLAAVDFLGVVSAKPA